VPGTSGSQPASDPSQWTVIDRNPLLATLNYAKGQALHRLGLRRHRSGSTGFHLSLDGALDYICRVAHDYVQYGAGGDARRLEGKDVLEIGPGDNLGVALMLLSMGAESVTSIDGFAPQSDEQKNRRIYAALHERMTPDQRQRVAGTLIQDGAGMRIAGTRVRAFYNCPIENTHEALQAERYGIIVSRAVLEHLADIRQGWATMVRTLQPDGEMWHKVDFRSHCLFDGIHPLYFLTIPETLWNLISRPDPTLNRARLPVYRELIDRDFMSSTIYFTEVVGRTEFQPHSETLIPNLHFDDRQLSLLQAIRPRLQEPFRNYSDEELMVSGIFLISRQKRRRAQ
jgi:hypothetical protein